MCKPWEILSKAEQISGRVGLPRIRGLLNEGSLRARCWSYSAEDPIKAFLSPVKFIHSPQKKQPMRVLCFQHNLSFFQHNLKEKIFFSSHAIIAFLLNVPFLIVGLLSDNYSRTKWEKTSTQGFIEFCSTRNFWISHREEYGSHVNFSKE